MSVGRRPYPIFFVVALAFILIVPALSAADGPTIIFESDLVMDVPPDTPSTINVTVIGNHISSVVLHWEFSSSSPHDDSMVFIGNNMWSGTLPGQSDYGYFSYYITAMDSLGNESRFPKSRNLTLSVSDMISPTISFDNSTVPSFRIGETTNLTVEAEDNNQLSYVAFYYRYGGDVDWRSESMTASGSSYYLNFTPVKSGPIEFYFVAFDGRNRAYYPPAGAVSPIELTVSSSGLFGLSLTITVLMLISVILAVVDIVFYFRKKRGHSSGRDKPASGEDKKRKED